MKIDDREIFNTEIIENLKLLNKIDDDFVERVRYISLEDLIYLKLYTIYNKLEPKFLILYPIEQTLKDVIKNVVTRIKIQFGE